MNTSASDCVHRCQEHVQPRHASAQRPRPAAARYLRLGARRAIPN